MKKNYGIKEGQRVIDANSKEQYTVLKIFNAGKNNLGFKHAKIKFDSHNKTWLRGLSTIYHDIQSM